MGFARSFFQVVDGLFQPVAVEALLLAEAPLGLGVLRASGSALQIYGVLRLAFFCCLLRKRPASGIGVRCLRRFQACHQPQQRSSDGLCDQRGSGTPTAWLNCCKASVNAWRIFHIQVVGRLNPQNSGIYARRQAVQAGFCHRGKFSLVFSARERKSKRKESCAGLFRFMRCDAGQISMGLAFGVRYQAGAGQNSRWRDCSRF